MSLNLYTYCGNNPVIYIDPTGHWRAGDEDLNDDAKAEIIALTVAYNNATEKEEKKAIQAKANAIRNNESSKEVKDTLIDIKNEEAFDEYMNSAIKDRKLSIAEITEGLKLINAEVSTSSINKEPSAGVKVTLNNTTITTSKADISVNSTIVKKDTYNVTAEIDVKKTTHYSAYIFYLPEWNGEMEDAREQMASFYGISEDDIGTASITNSDELSSSWNMMGLAEGGENISTVVINTHGSPARLSYGYRDEDGSSDPDERFTSSQISALNNKNIDNLILLGCNAGHLDYSNNNPAALFSQKINGGRVLASDGTVESCKSIF